MKRFPTITSLLLLAALWVTGCTQPAGTPAPSETASGDDRDHAPLTAGTQATAAGHDHSGWWCTEHGIPEEVCSMCNSKIAAEFQKKGDWCSQHERADSQCFICHPELEAKFAAQYEAKYGELPPKPEG